MMNIAPLSPMDIGVVLSTLTSAADDYLAVAERNSAFPEIERTMRERSQLLLDVAKRVEWAAAALPHSMNRANQTGLLSLARNPAKRINPSGHGP
jgi:hypothetical protein